MKKKLVIKFLMVFLIMLIAVPVLAEGGVSVESISGSSQNKDIVLNATDKIDIQFNELEQSAEYNLTLKNNTDKVVYVHDVVAENLSEEFIDFSLAEKSVDTKIEPGKEGKINVLVETLDIDHAGRNVDEQVTLKILLGNSVLNPSTNSNFITVFLIVFMIALFYFMMTKRSDKLNKISIFIIAGLLISVTTVYANNNYATVEGKVKFSSKNLLQGSGVALNGSVIDYSNATKIWKDASKVKKIIISDDKKEIKDYEEKFDLTTDSSERVVSYFVKNDDEVVPYDLHIQSKGVIYAPADSTGLFAFPNVESIEGLDYIEFDETTKMTAMFKDNKKLKKVDLSAIDMSNVTDASYMFRGCDELEVSEDDITLNDTVVKDNMFPSILKIVSGDLNTIGSIVAIGSEKFYVIGHTIERYGEYVNLLSMYNLHVGNSVDSDWNVTPLMNPTGIQDSSARGFNGEYPIIGATPFSSASQKGTNYSDYNGSIVEGYVDNYASYLESKGVNIYRSRLINGYELQRLGCFGYDDVEGYESNCDDAPEWVYVTSYWTGHLYDDHQIYVVGVPWGIQNYSIDTELGVRPVIGILVSEF